MQQENLNSPISKQFAPHYIPAYFWELLSSEDKAEYLALQQSLLNRHCSQTKERHSQPFKNELQAILSYIERRPELQETRCIISGVFFGNSFVCVNTRQLKYLIGRCKSSINNGFQQLGYMSTKTKVRQCILSVLPSLLHDQSLLRQWTMRCYDKKLSNESVPLYSQKISRLPISISSLDQNNMNLYNNNNATPECAYLPPNYNPNFPVQPNLHNPQNDHITFPNDPKSNILINKSNSMIQLNNVNPVNNLNPLNQIPTVNNLNTLNVNNVSNINNVNNASNIGNVNQPFNKNFLPDINPNNSINNPSFNRNNPPKPRGLLPTPIINLSVSQNNYNSLSEYDQKSSPYLTPQDQLTEGNPDLSILNYPHQQAIPPILDNHMFDEPDAFSMLSESSSIIPRPYSTPPPYSEFVLDLNGDDSRTDFILNNPSNIGGDFNDSIF